ncbi:MAG: HD domain-containing protein [Chloroflexota bacterium]
MIFTSKIQESIQFATAAHAGQTRKGKDIPYITHPLSVALVLARAGADEDVVVAGVLHDTVEDSGGKIGLDEIERAFGGTVAGLVRHVTEEDKSLSWEERKRIALAHIYEMPYGALLLKSADALHNLSELVDDVKEHGNAVFDKFNAPEEKKIEQQQKLMEAMETVWPENPLLPEIKEGVAKLQTKAST